MSKSEYLTHLTRRLRDLESRVEADEKRLAGGSPQEKVGAAGDLAIVRRQLDETKQKLSELEAEPESAWETVKSAIEDDVGELEAAFDRWVQEKD